MMLRIDEMPRMTDIGDDASVALMVLMADLVCGHADAVLSAAGHDGHLYVVTAKTGCLISASSTRHFFHHILYYQTTAHTHPYTHTHPKARTRRINITTTSHRTRVCPGA